jgi:hypothetical protein
VLVGLAAAGEAGAKSFSLPQATVVVTLQSDGSLLVEEHITFNFDGSFSGAFRDIPARQGEVLDDIFIEERGRQYDPGASAELGSSGAPYTYGVAQFPDRVRIVWHYSAFSDIRTFTIGYRLRGLAVAYDDVVDVNLKVWGDEWEQQLGQLNAVLLLPKPASGTDYRVWGHPVSVRGDVSRAADHVELRAERVPAHQFVELRTVFPRSLLDSTAGTQVRHEEALDSIVAAEQAEAASFGRDQEKIQDALDNLPRTIAILLALAFLPAFAIAGLTYWFLGRERGSGYDREYEQEPPTGLEPALVPPLVRQSPKVGSLEFTATLFDLIRRGHYKAVPVTTERSVWAGLRHEAVADLEVSRGDELELASHEGPVAHLIDEVLNTGPERLSNFRERITTHRTENSKRFTAFKDAVGDAVRERGWFVSTGLPVLLGVGVFFAGLGALLLWLGIERFESFAPRWSDVLLIALQRAALAPPPAGGRRGGGALGGVSPLPHRLPPPGHRHARLARALGALPRLWDRVRHRRAGVAGRPPPHAGRAARPELDLLDQPERRPRLGTLRARNRRPQRRLRERPGAPLERLGRFRRGLFGRRRRRRRRRWWRRLVIPV